MRVEVQNLIKRFGNAFTLDIPLLKIESGRTFGLVGNNGAGKTTFLRLMLDLLNCEQGMIKIGPNTVVETDAWKANVGAYLDDSFLLDYLTPLEFFAFVGSLYGFSKTESLESLDPYRSFLPSEVFNSRSPYIRDLSTGNAKKVGIVAALFVKPDVVVLDETVCQSRSPISNHLKKLFV